MPRAGQAQDTSPDTENGAENPKTSQKRDKWTPAMLVTLVATFLEEKKQGRQAESGWTSESYNKVVTALKASGVQRTAKQVKSCWTRLKGQYKIMKEMLTLSGFGLNPTTKILEATDEVWAAYLEKHPKHKPFRDRPFVHFDDMAVLCDDVMATGEDAFSNGLTGGNSAAEAASGGEFGSLGKSDEEDEEEEEDGDEDEDERPALGNISNSTPRKKPVQNSVVSSQKASAKRTRHGRVSSTTVLAGLAASVETLAAAFQDESQSSKSSDSPSRRDKAWNIMLAEEGATLNDDQFAAAVEVFGDSKFADQYLKFPVERKAARRKWLDTAIARIQNM